MLPGIILDMLYLMMSVMRTVSHSYLPAVRSLPADNSLGPSL